MPVSVRPNAEPATGGHLVEDEAAQPAAAVIDVPRAGTQDAQDPDRQPPADQSPAVVGPGRDAPPGLFSDEERLAPAAAARLAVPVVTFASPPDDEPDDDGTDDDGTDDDGTDDPPGEPVQ